MSERLRVLLAQLPVPNNPGLNTPLAAGYLVAYATAQGLAARVDLAILPRALADHAGDAALVAAIVAHAPDVLGLSLYTWNSERSLHIAARVRAQLPNLRVIVGGPEVQTDNSWVLAHPAVDLAVIGEGEQTFAAVLSALSAQPSALSVEQHSAFSHIPGLAYRTPAGELIFTADRVALQDLSGIPSPYLSGLLDDTPPDGMLMVEVSRWCPYSCSFCLYGRNMGPRLGSRYFGIERLLAEIVWGRTHGLRTVHFVEANLNLVPVFWPLMHALADLNADKQLTFYAELRAEHLTPEVVAALDTANVRVVEVGLQTANLTALRASQRRTDLSKWAAGTRRLYAAGIEVLLDVILGLPADDRAGVAETLDFLRREQLGAYDIFTLQVLPGTAVRREAATFAMAYQDRPPYYVLATDQLDYAALRTLRRELKYGADLDPDAIEGMPAPRQTALAPNTDAPFAQLQPQEVGNQLDLVLAAHELPTATAHLAGMIAANPYTVIDVYLHCVTDPPLPDELTAWRNSLPFTPGYLDRVAVYTAPAPDPPWVRVSPRLWLVLPWSLNCNPEAYIGVAGVIWAFDLEPGAALPLGAWRAAGGAGIWLRCASDMAREEQAAALHEAQRWATTTGRLIYTSSP